MKLPNTTSKETATPVETAAATPPNSRKRPLSAANSQGVGPLRPPSRAPSAMGHWGPALCAPQIAIPDSRLHLTTSSRPRSRFNSVRKIGPSISREKEKKIFHSYRIRQYSRKEGIICSSRQNGAGNRLSPRSVRSILERMSNM